MRDLSKEYHFHPGKEDRFSRGVFNQQLIVKGGLR